MAASVSIWDLFYFIPLVWMLFCYSFLKFICLVRFDFDLSFEGPGDIINYNYYPFNLFIVCYA